MAFGSGRGRGRGGGNGGGGSTRYKAAPRFMSRAGNSTAESVSTTALAPVDPLDEVRRVDAIDEALGFPMMREGKRVAWLVNMLPTLRPSVEWPGGCAAVDFYFIQDDGQRFKASLVEQPYFLIACAPGREPDVEEYLRRKFGATLCKLVRQPKEDLDLPNHLLGHRRTYLKLCFHNSDDLADVKRALMPAIRKNQGDQHVRQAYANFYGDGEAAAMHDDDDDEQQRTVGGKKNNYEDGLDFIVDIREHDVPYLARVCIDHEYRVGLWYTVTEENGLVSVEQLLTRVLPADPVVLAFDIETSKAPLKFPDAQVDPIMMISYMIDRQGYLITNREIVSDDIVDFDYSPKPGEFDGPFIIFNEADEQQLLVRFFEHIRQTKPAVFVTYNGDFFDWPYVETRAKLHDIDMRQQIGVWKNSQGEYTASYASHMDCFKWVKRDSYLPQGSQGLKAVTKYKLGYDPKELDPELMTRYAVEFPQILADYSVSDAVATYYLYMKYVHPFVFSLCNIIPLNPDDVLRKGSGTLCEMLLMVEAFRANIIMPNKHVTENGKLYEGHLLDSETYVGGHVEALESGVFRSDISTHFRLDPKAFQTLLNDLTRALTFFITKEENKSMNDVLNFDEVRDKIAEQLQHFCDHPNGSYEPLIYHLDVAAMYPNIILTNRLQPPALIDEETCAACDFNRPDANCQRRMQWSWRGEYFPADRSEYNMIKNQLESERFPPVTSRNDKEVDRSNKSSLPMRTWSQLTVAEQSQQLSKRLSDYSRKVYKKIHESKVEQRESIVCQRENPFYVDTVKKFRDRRYEYKTKLKVAKRDLEQAMKSSDPTEIDSARKMTVLWDSLQLAHKCILNSFYGYVMRRGSRWYSMEMAGIVCLTGANIIKMAREIVERIGRPLELDTDGIWCILPRGFPENFEFRLRGENGKEKSLVMSYPGAMLNHLVQDQFTNDQYQTLTDPETFEYATTSENSIFFEVDGPYRAMILPASKEENKLLKKRYAVFDEAGRLAELKGFEIKRRGELKIIKIFQEEVFSQFLRGSDLLECYTAVAAVANRWLDILYTRGATVTDDDLMEYISENRSMSKTLEEYGTQKSTSISTAKRLAEFLGDQMVKDKGLACKFIIAQKPIGAPVAERAIPLAIFAAEPGVKRHFLRRWLLDQSLVNFDVRTILDWQYYIERLGSSVQKLITIPAAMQGLPNPVPRIVHPDWLLKRGLSKNGLVFQQKITDIFQKTSKPKIAYGNEKAPTVIADVEDVAAAAPPATAGLFRTGTVTKRARVADVDCFDQTSPTDMTVDYHAWLAGQRIKWRERRLRKLANPLDTSLAAGSTSIFHRQQMSMLRRTWEIIQVAETDIPGHFRLWVLVDRQLKAVRINVPRIFQVNCREPDEKHLFTVCSKILPRSHVAHNLYELVVDEADYQENDAVYKSFQFHHDTVGVYELQVPLLYRALLRLGCVAKLDPRRGIRLRRGADDLHQLDDFEDGIKNNNRHVGTGDYLNQRRLHYLYLYHSSCDTRQTFCLWLPASGTAFVVIVDPFQTGQLHLPSLARMYNERRADFLARFGGEQSEEESLFEYPETVRVDATSVKTEKEAHRLLQRALSDYQKERNGPTAVLVQSPHSIQMMSRRIRLLGDFPLISVPSKKKENIYPALDWQRFCAKYMVQNFLFVHAWLLDRLILSRYANVPIANIDADATAGLSDLLYGRMLTERSMVLWYSATERPDLGGREDDDNYFSVQSLATDPVIDSSGLYKTVCIEYQLDNLPMNAILQSAHINEMEGSDANAGLASGGEMSSIEQHMAKSHDKNEVAIDQSVNQPAYAAFRTLKDLVKSWAKEFHAFGNPIGEIMFKNFYRWLSSANFKLYDPAMYAYVHGLMRKSLMLLVAEFKRLGAMIVHADLNKLVIVTTKTSYENAVAYNDFILKTIKSKDVFFWIECRPVKYWSELVWMDRLNYGGVEANGEVNNGADENDSIPSTPNGDNNQNKDDMQSTVSMHWNIGRFLPPLIQPIFTRVVADFILRVHDLKVKRRGGLKPGQTPVKGISRNISLSQARAADPECLSEQILIREYFTRSLLKILPDVQQAVAGAAETDEQLAAVTFPRLPGSHLQLNNPALELVKYTCHIFGLHRELENEVRVMRRTLLNLIGVREFSPEAVYQNPCDSFILPLLFCSFCQHCRDLDLASDTGVTVSSKSNTDNSTTAWLCPHCHHHYDQTMIEESLVHMVQRMLTAYQLQDLHCPKCRLTKVENLREQCKNCAGPYALAGAALKSVDERRSVVRKLKVLKNIASVQQMMFLTEAVDWALQAI